MRANGKSHTHSDSTKNGQFNKGHWEADRWRGKKNGKANGASGGGERGTPVLALQRNTQKTERSAK